MIEGSPSWIIDITTSELLCWLSVTFLLIASSLSILCALLNHDRKIKLLESFHRFDNLLLENFNQRVDEKSFKKTVKRVFAMFLTMNGFCYVSVICATALSQPKYLLFLMQLLLTMTIVRLQNFQFYVFMKAFESQMKVLGQWEANICLGIEIRELFKLFNLTFGFSVAGSFLQTYSTILDTSNWIAMSILGFVPSSYMFQRGF